MAFEAFRDNFDAFVEKHGGWVVYIRTDPNMECLVCSHNNGSGESPATCPNCFGTGQATSIEKDQILLVKTRLVTRRDIDIKPGLVVDGEIRFHTKANLSPGIGDIILEVAWDCTPDKIATIGEPVNIIHVYKVEQVEPQYVGRVICYSGVLELQDFKKTAISKALFGVG